MILLLSFATLSILGDNQTVKASAINFIYIKPDGNVEPAGAPINREGYTYTLTDDLNYSVIIVEVNNLVIDGAEHTLDGSAIAYAMILAASNITVKNVKFDNYWNGITNTILSGKEYFKPIIQNQVKAWHISDYTDVYDTDYLISSSHRNIISQNVFSNIIGKAIWLVNSSDNLISQNIINGGERGISLCAGCSYNLIAENRISNTKYGIAIECYPSATLYYALTNNTITKNLVYHSYDYTSSICGLYLQGRYCFNNSIKNNIFEEGLSTGSGAYDMPGTNYFSENMGININNETATSSGLPLPSTGLNEQTNQQVTHDSNYFAMVISASIAIVVAAVGGIHLFRKNESKRKGTE